MSAGLSKGWGAFVDWRRLCVVSAIVAVPLLIPPFIVGEFANKSPPGCGAALQYAGLIDQAEKKGVGWLAWSWGDDDPGSAWNTDCDEFDMTSTFAFDSLMGWGKEVAVTHAASIKNTAKRPQSLMSGECR